MLHDFNLSCVNKLTITSGWLSKYMGELEKQESLRSFLKPNIKSLPIKNIWYNYFVIKLGVSLMISYKMRVTGDRHRWCTTYARTMKISLLTQSSKHKLGPPWARLTMNKGTLLQFLLVLFGTKHWIYLICNRTFFHCGVIVLCIST